jgi:hypothetical protein
MIISWNKDVRGMPIYHQHLPPNRHPPDMPKIGNLFRLELGPNTVRGRYDTVFQV